MEEPADCCFDAWAHREAVRARRRRVHGVSAILADLLAAEGLSGRTVLDLGCGAGGLAVETVARGARAASGVDLSAAMIGEARRLSEEAGTADRTTFDVGDGATAALAPHDVVVLNKVFCCYPHVGALLANSLAAAGSVFAFALPASRGVRGSVARRVIGFENVLFRLRPSTFHGFRVFVHDVDAIDAEVRAAGFGRPVWRRRFGWDVAVYART
ncbi:MAG: methyltransferase domain-containing protein [Actinomycetota bacterium]